MYEIKGNANMKGRLSIFFATNEEALNVPTAFSQKFTNSGVTVGPGETVKVRAISELMIFGHYNVPGATLQSWNRDGEEAPVVIKRNSTFTNHWSCILGR